MSRQMKDSGIEWIGQIPSDWNTRKIKFSLKERIEKNDPIKSRDILSLTAKQGVIPLSEREGGGNKPKEDFSAYRLAYPGDIVMNSMNIISGSVGLSNYFGCVSPVYYMLRPIHKDDDVRFYNYVFQTKSFQLSLFGLGNGILVKQTDDDKFNTVRLRIPMDKLGDVEIPCIIADEQKIIADFLDRKCSAIDTAIEKTKKSIEKLEEYKKAVITKAVTKGLDPNAKMKDSGIEWIGEVPETWDVKRIKYACLERKEKKIFKDAPNRYIGLENVESYTGHFIDTESTYLPGVYDVCYENDILFGKLRPYLAKVIMAPYEAACTGEFLIIKNFVGEIKFLFYWLANKEFVKAVDVSTYGAKMPRANTEFIMNLPICLPSDKEQQQILSYLDDKCASIDVLISKKQDAINKWEEYKKSLIYYAVTGKIDCRNEVI